jgi:hypothetical protein
MSSIDREVADTVETIASDVQRWPSDKQSADYTVKKLPAHLVVWQLVKRLGGEHDVAGTGNVITVKRRP